MFRSALCHALVAAAVLLGSQAAFAENRVALVIGNSAYRAVAPLPNAENDAKAMAELLGAAGFEVAPRRSVAERPAQDRRRIRGKARREGTGYDGAGVLCRPRHPGRRREFSGAGRRRSEARGRRAAAGGAAQRSAEHAELGAEQDAHPDAGCLPQQSVPVINQTTGQGLAMVDTKSARPARSFPIRRRRAPKPKTAPAPTVPTRPR